MLIIEDELTAHIQANAEHFLSQLRVERRIK
jgi:hypothetical protein